MKSILGGVMILGWVVLGLMQITAVADGIQHWLGWYWLICWVIAFFVGGWPVVGTILGMVGAHYAWGWSWLAAFLLFWGLIAAIMLLTMTVTGAAVISERFRRQRSPAP